MRYAICLLAVLAWAGVSEAGKRRVSAASSWAWANTPGAAPCTYCTDCKCAPGDCPGKCPVQAAVVPAVYAEPVPSGYRATRQYRLPAKLPEAQLTTMSHAEMSKWRAKCPASTVNTMVAGRVIDMRSGTEEVLSPWTLYVSTFADVDAAVARAKSGEMAEVRPSIVIRIGETPIYLNGELFDPRDCAWFPEGHEGEPHHEFLRWYAYTGACRIDKRPGGGWDFTSLEGAVRDAAYRGGGAEPDAPHILANYFKHEIRSLKECRTMWALEKKANPKPGISEFVKPVQFTESCPGGVCPLPNSSGISAAPVAVSQCAGGNCAAPVQSRGLFGFRRW